MADYRNVEMRIMAATLKHAEEGGPVPALRLGDRADLHDERAKALNYADWYGVNQGMFK